jgi:hypothetical protein
MHETALNDAHVYRGTLRVTLLVPSRMITQTKQDWHSAALSMLGSVGMHCAVGGRSGDDKRSPPGRTGVRSGTARPHQALGGRPPPLNGHGVA